MKVLFLTLLNLEDLTKKGIYHDFVNELSRRGHNVSVVCPSEKRFGGRTELIKTNGIEVLKVLIGDITQTSNIKKGINTLRIEKTYEKAIHKFFKNKDFDLIIYTTPPITFNKLVYRLKRKNNAKTYLLLKDIFPQNAVDLGMFSKNGPIYKLFRSKEKQLYKISDYIGGMSEANIEFIKNHNPITAKTQVIRNALYEIDYALDNNVINKEVLFEKYNIDSNKRIFLYGGNLGVPQGISFIKKVMKRFNEVENGFLLVVGSGTHSKDLINYADELGYRNVRVMNILPKEEYDQLVALSDVGLIFLDHRFTIPNYPSRLTSLLNAKKPILMATDENTDIKNDVLENNCGLWSKSDDVSAFIKNAIRMSNEDLSLYSENSYKLYKKQFRIEDNIDNLIELVSK